ncbi:MAG: hypothetical protein ACOC5R_00460 [Elusimicrobiota bacterium]
MIDDDGNIQKTSDMQGLSSRGFKNYLYGINFERKYECSEFSDEIDLVFSSKLLIDSGILSFPSPGTN